MAQSLEVKARAAPARRELRWPFPDTGRLDSAEREPVETRAPARGYDVFRLVVALCGIAAFLALPAALVAGVVILLSR
jgi:hypothetical protein